MSELDAAGSPPGPTGEIGPAHWMWHTILSDGLRPEVAANELGRRRIEAHLGRYIAEWVYVEFWLRHTVAAWANPDAPGRLTATLEKVSTYGQIEMLKTLVPAGWRDARTVLRLLAEGNTYRNQLAHFNLAQSGIGPGGRQYGWHLFSGTTAKTKRLELDEKRLANSITEVTVLRAAIGTLGTTEILGKPVEELNATDLAVFIIDGPGTWDTHEERDAFVRQAQTWFPKP